MEHTGGGGRAARPGRSAGRAAVRGAGDVRAAAAAGPGRPVRRRRRRRAVRRRRRPTGPARASGRRRSARGRGCCAAITPGWRCDRSRTSRWPTPATSPARRSRSTRRSRRSRRARGRCLARRGAFVALGGDHTDRAAVAARGARAPRPGRADPLRRAPRHVGHVLRRAVHARHPVPPRARGRAARDAIDARTSGSAGRCSRREDLVDDAGFGFTIVGGVRLPDAVGRRRSPTSCANALATCRSTCRSTST